MRYPELFEASRDTVQPDGAALTDPDLLRPGWEITIPGQAKHKAEVPEEPLVEDVPPGDVAPPVASPSVEPTAEPTESADQEPTPACSKASCSGRPGRTSPLAQRGERLTDGEDHQVHAGRVDPDPEEGERDRRDERGLRDEPVLDGGTDEGRDPTSSRRLWRCQTPTNTTWARADRHCARLGVNCKW